METLEERFQKGMEIRNLLGGGGDKVFRGSIPSAYELAPDMFRIVTECLYGSIWTRPGLDIKYRMMVVLTATVVQRAGIQIRSSIQGALNLGLSPEEIVEILIQSAFYSGLTSGYNALEIAKEIFEERGIQCKPQEIYDPNETPESLYERGLARHRELTSDVFGYYSAEPTEEEHGLDELMTQYFWGSIRTRPGLDMKSRIFCALACQLTQGPHDRSFRRMIEGALRYGLTRKEIMEACMQLGFYVGTLPSRSAMAIANSVFRSPEFSVSGTPGL